MTLWIFSAVYLVVQCLAVASAVHALFTVRTAQGTVAWVIGLLAVPWLALPLYWVFGCRRFGAHARVMSQKQAVYQTEIQAVLDRLAPYQVTRKDLVPADAAAFAELAGQEFLRGNTLRRLIDGDETFDAIIAEIEQAKHSVYVQFYIMRNDGLGNRLLEAMAAKAAQGVEACFLFDMFGGAAMTKEVQEKWRRRGVQMAAFCSTSSGRDRWRGNFRNHRKNVIVDGRVGFVGGHNVGDEYLGLDPKFGRWRDTHVRVEGPTALQLQRSFAADWYFVTDRVVDRSWVPHDPEPDAAGQRALVLDSGPSDDFERCTLFFLHAIGMAKSRIWIASPYFVPDEGVLQALQLAAVRGVEVRVLLPQKADHLFVWLASFNLLKELDHPNMFIHRFTGGFLHHKALVVDDHFAAVGTANFDNRSFRLNFEITLAVADKKFAGEVAVMFERDFAESMLVDAMAYHDLPFHWKLGAKISRLLAPIL